MLEEREGRLLLVERQTCSDLLTGLFALLEQMVGAPPAGSQRLRQQPVLFLCRVDAVFHCLTHSGSVAQHTAVVNASTALHLLAQA